jgi:hypothetical protein
MAFWTGEKPVNRIPFVATAGNATTRAIPAVTSLEAVIMSAPLQWTNVVKGEG